MAVVIVESPTKAKTISKYLGPGYTVLSSFGHVRDLPAKNGSVDPDHNFQMVWEMTPQAKKHLKAITDAIKQEDELYLASDPDREGEAIAWHLKEYLNEKKLLQKVKVQRIVFHEITKKAIKEAVDHPRELNEDLISAYLARRALDFLVGFNLSPILWRKLPGSRSAGRVQSVALRLITDRETDIETFTSQEYWTLDGHFQTQTRNQIQARLTHIQGQKLDKFALPNEKSVRDILDHLDSKTFRIAKIEKKEVKRHPAAPFITSTLQQEAARKLYFGASKTMRVAQQLYEGVEMKGEMIGLISYMRTDSVNLSQDALTGSRQFIQTTYGDSYVPSSPRAYKSKAKNAQEAHEAIRPTNFDLPPESVRGTLSEDQFKLYSLIWKRMLASQMESAVFEQKSVDISDPETYVNFRATGSTVKFDGFLKIYEEGKDDETDGKEQNLPQNLHVEDRLTTEKFNPEQHFTSPPPRYSEASLVKKLEELGIGRPSTYANIIRTLQDRQYVDLEKRRFFPTSRGRLVTAFLTNFFNKYVEFDFTAGLEEQLDEISSGHLEWHQVLHQFWEEFIQTIKSAEKLRITDVLDYLEENLTSLLFPAKDDGTDPRKCPKCEDGKLNLKIGKFGAFIGCSHYPECNFTRKFSDNEQGEDSDSPQQEVEDTVLGKDPNSDEDVVLKKGPYGFYFQWGTKPPAGKKKPKRAALPKGVVPQDATLEMALDLGKLPREVGQHPETGKKITAGVGRFGPYVLHDKSFTSLKKDDNVLTISVERALELMKDAAEKKAKAPPRRKKK